MLVTLGFVWALGASIYILVGLYAMATDPTSDDSYSSSWALVALLFLAAFWPVTVWLSVWDIARDDGRGEL